MKSQYELRWDGEVLDLRVHPNIRKAMAADHRVIWNHKGMRGVIPPALLTAQFQLLDAYSSRLRSHDAAPPGVGLVYWESVVRVPSLDHLTSLPTDEDA